MSLYVYTTYLFHDSQTGYFGALETEPNEEDLQDDTYVFFKIVHSPYMPTYYMYHPAQKQWVKLEPKKTLDEFYPQEFLPLE